MTEMQFNFHILFSIWKRIGSAVAGWFDSVLANTSSWKFYLSCITIFFFVKYLIRPIVGNAMSTGQSDKAKPSKSGQTEISVKNPNKVDSVL